MLSLCFRFMHVCLLRFLSVYTYIQWVCVHMRLFTFMYRRPKADLWILFQYVSILLFECRAHQYNLVSNTLDCSAGISSRPPVPQWQVGTQTLGIQDPSPHA